MVIRTEHQIKRWADWDHEIDAAAQGFIEDCLFAPNIMLANDQTHAQIDVAASSRRRHNIRSHEDDSPLPDGEFAAIDSFEGTGYTLQFCVDPKVPDKCFFLIFDDDPDGDGELIPHVLSDMSEDEFLDSLRDDAKERKAG